MIGFRIVPGARQDLRESVVWYKQNSGMTSQFLNAVATAFQRLETDPHSLPLTESPWPSRGRRTRRCPVEGFPFQVIFEIQPTEIVVLAVAHGSRKPSYWKRRN